MLSIITVVYHGEVKIAHGMSKNMFTNKNGELHHIVGNHENNPEHEVDGAKESIRCKDLEGKCHKLFLKFSCCTERVLQVSSGHPSRHSHTTERDG